MSFFNCIKQKVESGELSEERADVIIERFEEMKDRHPANPELDKTVEKEITEKLLDDAEKSIAKEEYRTLNDAFKINKLLNDMEEINRYASNIDNLGEGSIALLSKDFGGLSSIESVEQIQDAFQRQYNGYISSFWEKVNDATGQDDSKVVGEKLLRAYLDGDNVDEFHNQMANEFEKLFSVIAEDAKLRGMNLAIDDKYFPNPIHAKESIINAEFNGKQGKQAWVEYVMRGDNGESLLDRQKMKNFDTDEPLPDHAPSDKKSLMGPEGDDDDFGLLGRIYDRITKSHDPERDIGTFRQTAFRNKNNQSRILYFKDSEAWMDYNSRFGTGEVTNAVKSYIQKMSRDIAAMDRFGSRPEKVKKIIKDFIDKKADEYAEEGKIDQMEANAKAQNNKDSFEENWNAYFNQNRMSPNKWARGITVGKQVTTSATIGSAIISAVGGDTGNSAFTAWFNGLPQMRIATGGIKTFAEDVSQKALRKTGLWKGKTAQEAQQQMSIEAGLTARAVIDESVGYARILRKQEGLKSTKWMANKSLKWQGLNLFTRSGRTAFQIETGKYLAKLANNNRFDELSDVVLTRPDVEEAGFMKMLERYNIGEEEWRILRETPFKKEMAEGFAGKQGKAFEWFRPIDIESEEMVQKTGLPQRKLRETANKFRRLIATEEGHAVPTINNRSRALTSKFFGRGDTLIGQAASQYKSFPLTQLTNNFSRAMMANGNGVGMGSFASKALGAYLGYLVPLGAVAIQMREIAKGNDPKDMTEPSFVMDALAQSGGLSIFGDVLLRGRMGDTSFMNNQVLDVASGPTFGFLDSTLDLTLDNSFAAASPEQKASFGADTADFARQWMPFNNIWYSRLATDRLIFDKLEELADPQAKRRFNQKYRRQIMQDNQGAFSPPGSGLGFITEGDAPDLQDAIGGESGEDIPFTE